MTDTQNKPTRLEILNYTLEKAMTAPCYSEEEMLQNQAKALDMAFHFMLQQSFLNSSDGLYIMEEYAHLAIKLQQQCATTYKALQAARYMNDLTTLQHNKAEALPHPHPATNNEQTIDEA